MSEMIEMISSPKSRTTGMGMNLILINFYVADLLHTFILPYSNYVWR